MTKIISISNHKGGVGKTTTAVSVGACLAGRGYKTLLIDLDAQANLTASLLRIKERQRTIFNALREREGLPVEEVDGSPNLFVVPADLDLAGAELELSSTLSREYALKDALDTEAPKYDFVFIDCPPSLSLLTLNALTAADEVLVPTLAQTLPYRGLAMIDNFIRLTKKRLNPALKWSGIIITSWLGQNLEKVVEDDISSKYGDLLLNTKIRKNIALAEAPTIRKCIFEYAGRSNGARDYSALTDELLQRWGYKLMEKKCV